MTKTAILDWRRELQHELGINVCDKTNASKAHAGKSRAKKVVPEKVVSEKSCQKLSRAKNVAQGKFVPKKVVTSKLDSTVKRLRWCKRNLTREIRWHYWAP